MFEIMPSEKKRPTGKPTGSVGPFSVSRDETGQIKGNFDKIEFSRDKERIELSIAESFLLSMNKSLVALGEKPKLHNLRKNQEDDYDFSIMEGTSQAYLELTENIPPSRIRERSADPGHIIYDPSEFAHDIHANIMKKSRHYGRTKDRILLLTYSTHWSFRLTDGTVACLRVLLHRDKPVFRAVFSYDPLDEHEGVVRWLYPVPSDLRPREVLWRTKGQWVMVMDPRNFQVTTGQGSDDYVDVGVRIPPPPENE